MAFVLLRVTTALLLLGLAVPAAAGQRVVVLTLEDTIQPASVRYLQRGIEAADRSGAEVTIIDLNTPGGLLTSLRQMTTAITQAKRPVVVYVTPSGAQAASAGFFLLIAADVAAMAPGTNAGAAHPVSGEGQDLAKTMSEKVTNDAAALIRSLAEQRGRNLEWAEKAVRQSLSYSATEALHKGLIDLIADNRAALLRELNGREVKRFDGAVVTLHLDAPEVVRVDPTFVDRLLSVIAHPNIAYVLFLVGLVGIYFELSHPGAILPGVLGGISLLLALFAMSVLPVNYVGLLLIVLSVVFFIAEVKVTSYGLLAVAGLVSFILGSLMLINSPFPSLRVGLSVILPAAVAVGAIVILLLSRVLRAHRSKPLTGAEGLVGEIGRAVGALSPEGRIFVHGEYWSAHADGLVADGALVRVMRVRADRLEVEPVAEEAPPGGG